MPIYEYQCGDCHHQFDTLQKMSEAPLTDCPVCHKASLQKMVSATSFQLKGTGWYETDFKTKAPASATTTSASDTSSSATTNTTTTTTGTDKTS